jgi:hypothetical protein
MAKRCLASLLILCAACGGPPGTIHVAPDESRPHITWEIRTGGEFGDGQFVCGSAKPAAACTLAASTDQRRSLVILHLFLHAAARQTNYVGAWRAPFLQGWTAKDYRDVSGTVSPGGEPYDVSVSCNVTDVPGKYAFSVLLDGAQEGVPDSNRIAVEIPVTVNSN